MGEGEFCSKGAEKTGWLESTEKCQPIRDLYWQESQLELSSFKLICIVGLYIFLLLLAFIEPPSWITALPWQRRLCNLMKLWSMLCKATQDRQIIVKSSEKTRSTGGGYGKPLQYSWQENPMNYMKRQKDTTLEEEPPGQKVSSMLLGKRTGQLLMAAEWRKQLGQSWNDVQLWVCLVVKVKSSAVKNNIA